MERNAMERSTAAVSTHRCNDKRPRALDRVRWWRGDGAAREIQERRFDQATPVVVVLVKTRARSTWRSVCAYACACVCVCVCLFVCLYICVSVSLPQAHTLTLAYTHFLPPSPPRPRSPCTAGAHLAPLTAPRVVVLLPRADGTGNGSKRCPALVLGSLALVQLANHFLQQHEE